MNHTLTELEAFFKDRNLVSFRRDQIGDGELQGYVIAMSAELVLFHHVRDFGLNGYLLIRKAHISNVRCHATNQFQHTLLLANGVYDRVDFDSNFSIDSWDHYLGSLPSETVTIVEQELSDPPLVHYGVFAGIDEDNFIKLDEFTGAANGTDDPTLIPGENITCVQVDSCYLRPYQSHFECNPRPKKTE